VSVKDIKLDIDCAIMFFASICEKNIRADP